MADKQPINVSIYTTDDYGGRRAEIKRGAELVATVETPGVAGEMLPDLVAAVIRGL